jgi:hypothetical protein
MAGFGDYGHFQALYTSKNTNVVLAATDGGKDNIIVPKSANHQLWIQKISYNPITAAAQAVTFQDDNGTPLKIATVPASQTLPIVFDFGPEGVPLTVGKNLDISNTAGPAAEIHIEAYERLGAVISYLAGASLQ